MSSPNSSDASSDSRAVEADRAQIELVILELVANAADAMSHGGTLEMGIQPVTLCLIDQRLCQQDFDHTACPMLCFR